MNSSRPRIGVMGGTFDPLHFGHLSAASEVADQLELDEVVFVPAGQPWQKAEQNVSDAEDRYAMTVLATAAHPKFRVSRIDIDRHGETYSVDTLRDLYEWYGADSALYFITGADTLANVNSWKWVDEVFQLATFVVVNRPGYSLDNSELPRGADVVAVDIPGMDIASTQCRERIAQGRAVWFLLPDDVVRYIASRGLYRQAGGP